MTSPISSALTSPLFGNPSAVACERAVAELRAGRPVRLGASDGRQLVVLALDCATPASYAAFAASAGQQHQLLITAERAAVLGDRRGHSLRLPLAGIAHDALPALAWLRPGTAPEALLAQAQAGQPDLDEAAVELAWLALLLPALVVLPLAQDLPGWRDAYLLPIERLQQAPAGDHYELVARTPVPLREIGWSEFVVFRGGIAQRDQVAIVVGKPDVADVVPVRVHSSCLTGDLFGSLKCDCGDQLRQGLAAIKAKGGGVLLYLDQEGRGTGIAAKMRAYGYQHEGLDTIDADAQLGFGADGRRYDAAVAMLKGLGIERIELLSNNPSKAARLSAAGIEVVQCTAVTGQVTCENEHYLRTKAARAGHHLDVDSLIAAAQR
jgi:GTP cyclohydrolase II